MEEDRGRMLLARSNVRRNKELRVNLHPVRGGEDYLLGLDQMGTRKARGNGRHLAWGRTTDQDHGPWRHASVGSKHCHSGAAHVTR